MSMFTKVGDFAHSSLLNGAGLSAMNQISSGAGVGAGLGAVNSMMTGQSSIMDGAISGAVTGAAFGAVGRYASMKYASGLNSFINSTTDASGRVFAGTKQSMVDDVSNFKFSHFSRSDTKGTHANYWHPDSTALKSTRFQDYKPQYSPAVNPTGRVSTSDPKVIDQWTKEFI